MSDDELSIGKMIEAIDRAKVVAEIFRESDRVYDRLLDKVAADGGFAPSFVWERAGFYDPVRFYWPDVDLQVGQRIHRFGRQDGGRPIYGVVMDDIIVDDVLEATADDLKEIRYPFGTPGAIALKPSPIDAVSLSRGDMASGIVVGDAHPDVVSVPEAKIKRRTHSPNQTSSRVLIGGVHPDIVPTAPSRKLVTTGVGKITDPSRFPHTCPRCGAPAYIGFASAECSDALCR